MGMLLDTLRGQHSLFMPIRIKRHDKKQQEMKVRDSGGIIGVIFPPLMVVSPRKEIP
jgi:hypothetical protein